jgi:hypothetical protein
MGMLVDDACELGVLLSTGCSGGKRQKQSETGHSGGLFCHGRILLHVDPCWCRGAMVHIFSSIGLENFFDYYTLRLRLTQQGMDVRLPGEVPSTRRIKTLFFAKIFVACFQPLRRCQVTDTRKG